MSEITIFLMGMLGGIIFYKEFNGRKNKGKK